MRREGGDSQRGEASTPDLELHCLRHGVTVGNARGIYEGRSDGVLTREQRDALARTRFDASGYDVVYCSPLGRCRQTARALGLADVVLDPRLAERDLGIFEGHGAAACQERFADAHRAFRRFDADYAIPEGESRAAHLARVESWLSDLGHHRRVLAITHGGVIDFLYRMATGIDLHGGARIFGSENASLSRFARSGQQLELLAFAEPLAR